MCCMRTYNVTVNFCKWCYHTICKASSYYLFTSPQNTFISVNRKRFVFNAKTSETKWSAFSAWVHTINEKLINFQLWASLILILFYKKWIFSSSCFDFCFVLVQIGHFVHAIIPKLIFVFKCFSCLAKVITLCDQIN